MSQTIRTLLLSAAVVVGGFALATGTTKPQGESVQASIEAARYFIEGESLKVTLRLEVTATESVELEPWALSSAAFSVDGRALGSRKGKKDLVLDPGQVLETTLNLAPAVLGLEAWDRRPFRLTYHGSAGAEPQQILFFEAAEKGIEFMDLPAEQLDDYQVILRTNRGDMWADFWPTVAEQHVRNYLDLSYTGFYDGTMFHRVIPGFMIQGGGAKPGSKAPRTVNAEFNDRKHTRGVLSMARLGGGQVNSATSEFFVMHARYPSLDGQYTAFGELLEGLEVVDKIVQTGNLALQRTQRNNPAANRPLTPQVIERAIVVRKAAAPKKD